MRALLPPPSPKLVILSERSCIAINTRSRFIKRLHDIINLLISIASHDYLTVYKDNGKLIRI